MNLKRIEGAMNRLSKVKALYEEGKDYVEIAKRLKTNKWNVQEALRMLRKRREITTNTIYQQRVLLSVPIVQQLSLQPSSVAKQAIAKKFNVEKVMATTIYNAAKKILAKKFGG
jgi:DNA-binding transcriptional regulator LsrR (DeoR family)